MVRNALDCKPVILVCGGRDFGIYLDEAQFIYKVLDDLLLEYPDMGIISGGARGADFVTRCWCNPKAGSGRVITPFKEFRAEWDKYGRRAGYLRYLKMRDVGKPDIVIAVPGGKGTEMMIRLAEEVGIEVRKFTNET